MERLYRDRMQYVAGTRDDGCFLCEAATTDRPEEMLVLDRSDLSLVILNKFPYNSGHLMVATSRHVGQIDELTADESAEVMKKVIGCVSALRSETHPDGFNVGANVGAAAGAGVPGHFHMHVVPRWAGDTNFMPVIGDAKVVPEILLETYRRLTPHFST